MREANFYDESSQYQHDRAYSICYTFTMKKKFPHEVTLHRISEMIEDLAVSTAKGFARNDERFDNLEKDIAELKENGKATRQAILNVGERFVPRYEFDNLLIRFNKLEQKIRGRSK